MLTNQTFEQTGQGIQLFNNPKFGSIRTAGTPDEPYFCLADICKAVDLTNPSSVKSRLDSEDVQLIDLHALKPNEGTITGNAQANFVNESGFYDVLLQSCSPKVKPFRKWITSEVLPAIRKTGGYIRQEEDDTEADIMAKALMIAQRTIDDKKQRIQILEGENELLQQENKALAPKAAYADDILQSTSTITFTEAAKELNFTSAQALLHKLVEERILYRISGRYMPMAKYSGRGYWATRTHRFFHSDGRADASVMTVVTQKGRMFLFNHFRKQLPQVDCTDVNLGGIEL